MIGFAGIISLSILVLLVMLEHNIFGEKINRLVVYLIKVAEIISFIIVVLSASIFIISQMFH